MYSCRGSAVCSFLYTLFNPLHLPHPSFDHRRAPCRGSSKLYSPLQPSTAIQTAIHPLHSTTLYSTPLYATLVVATHFVWSSTVQYRKGGDTMAELYSCGTTERSFGFRRPRRCEGSSALVRSSALVQSACGLESMWRDGRNRGCVRTRRGSCGDVCVGRHSSGTDQSAAPHADLGCDTGIPHPQPSPSNPWQMLSARELITIPRTWAAHAHVHSPRGRAQN